MRGLAVRASAVAALHLAAAAAAMEDRHARGIDLGEGPAVGEAGRRQPQRDGLSFVVMGDWGGRPGDGCVPAGQPNPTCGDESAVGPTPWSTYAQVATASGMSQVAKTQGSKFALALGDNFYFNGISTDCHGAPPCIIPSSNNRSDAYSARFNDTFEHVFTDPQLQADAGFAFYVVGGNHDHYGNVSAQVAYSELNPRWVFPSYYYTWTKPVDSRTTIQFVYIDTVVLSGNSDVHHPTTHELIRELRGSELPGPEHQGMADTQLAWLEKTLAASTADYLIVAGHYPIYSICEHGPTPDLINRVKPLLEAHRVTAYLNGHDHCEQHLQEHTGGVDYHTVGSAAINDESTAHKSAVPPGSLKFHSSGTLGGFASVTVTKQGLSLSHHDGHGKVLYAAPPHAPRDTAWLAGVAERLSKHSE